MASPTDPGQTASGRLHRHHNIRGMIANDALITHLAGEGSVAFADPGGGGWTRVRKLGGCVVVEPSVPVSSGPRSPGSGSHPR